MTFRHFGLGLGLLFGLASCGQPHTDQRPGQQTKPDSAQEASAAKPRLTQRDRVAPEQLPADAEASVNQELIMRSEIEKILKQILRQSPERIPPGHLQTLRQAILDDLIYAVITRQAITKGELVYDEQRFQELKSESDQKILERFESLDDFYKTVIPESHYVTEIKGLAAIKSPKHEAALPAWFEEHRQALGFGTRMQIRQIFIPVAENAAADIRQSVYLKIADLKTQLDQGADFAELAQQHSQSPSASQGGWLGSLSKAEMNDDIAEAVFAAQAGDVVGPLEGTMGYYLVKVEAVNLQSLTDIQAQPRLFEERVEVPYYNQVAQDVMAPFFDKADIIRRTAPIHTRP